MTYNITPEKLAEMISCAESVVALTGAGLSTQAGIPDFRGPNGLYSSKNYDPDLIFELSSFVSAPHHFFRFAAEFMPLVAACEPSSGHHFLAQLESTGKLTGIITQNIDLLHQKAGSKKVLELHGSPSGACCQRCGLHKEGLTLEWWQGRMALELDHVARCEVCDGVLKPDIVFFGEEVHGYQEAAGMVRSCDLLLVLGTSLQVAPASQLPTLCHGQAVLIASCDPKELPAAADSCLLVLDELDGFLSKTAACLSLAAS